MILDVEEADVLAGLSHGVGGFLSVQTRVQVGSEVDDREVRTNHSSKNPDFIYGIRS